MTISLAEDRGGSIALTSSDMSTCRVSELPQEGAFAGAIVDGRRPFPSSIFKRRTTFQVQRFETDSELKRHPVYFEGPGYKVGVAPDAWVLLTNGEDEYGIAWELDRATEQRTVFREKIRMLIYYSQGAYAAEF